MRRYAQRTIRPLIFIALLLLFLSVAAPWMWRALSIGPTPLPFDGQAVDGHIYHGSTPLTKQSVLLRRGLNEPSSVVTDAANNQYLPTEVEAAAEHWQLQAQSVAQRPVLLETLSIQPIIASVNPPAAELITLDPSLSETLETADMPSAHPLMKNSAKNSSKGPSLDNAEPMPADADMDSPLPPPTIRKPTLMPPKMVGVWPFAGRLIQQLNELAEEDPSAKPWTNSVLAALELLTASETLSDPRALEALNQLHGLAEEVRDLAMAHASSRERTLRLRVGYSIVRRLALWEKIADLSQQGTHKVTASIDQAQLAAAIQEVESALSRLRSGTAWQTYLRLDDLRTLSTAAGEPSAEQRLLAREVLSRLDSPRLNQEQFNFVSHPAFHHLVLVLVPIAQESLDWHELLENIEKHEAVDHSLDANRLASQLQVLRWSNDEQVRCLARGMNDNYRNANVRIAVSDQLLNRFLPPPEPMSEDVIDEVRGAQVFGRTESVAKLRLVLLPDRLRWRLGLEAKGAVASETESVKGPARFWNDGLGHFNARKLVTVDRRGMKVTGTETEASAENFLKDFETNFDNIPLFGAIARNIAKQQYDKEQPAARNEIEDKISQRASAKLDAEVERRLKQAEKEFQTKLLDPLDRLNLEPTPVQMETTANRLICRYRLAGQHQLAAHTPRPQAPGDSLLSMQLHQSVMNNTLENLKLDDRRVELRQLYVEMLQKFDAPDIKIPDDLPEDVTVHFAKQDAVRIECEDGRVRLAIRLQELKHADEHTWKNFEVHGYYKPSENQQEANLVRDGNLELAGERLRLADQVALRGIFAKVLSRNRTLAIVNKQLLLRKELADLKVTQFLIQDGWIGIALGPKPPEHLAPIVSAKEKDAEAQAARHPVREFMHRLR